MIMEPMRGNKNFYRIVPEEKKIIIESEDTEGLLSQMVGVISLQGLRIVSAKSINKIINEVLYFEDEFIVEFDADKEDSWFVNLPQRIDAQLNLIYCKKKAEAIKKSLEEVVVYLRKNKLILTQSPIVDIEISALDERRLSLKIEGEDSPFLLYIISNAIETQNLSIIEFFISTKEHNIEDVFFVRATKDIDAKELAILRFNLITNIQFIFLLKDSPDPYNAFLRFQEIINMFKTKEASEFLQELFSQKHKAGFATLLGSGDYLWEDFIRLHSLEVFKLFSDVGIETEERSPNDNEEELEELLQGCESYEDKILALNDFKDKKMFLIDIDNILKENNNVKQLSTGLSELAKTVVRQAAQLAEQRLQEMFGEPRSSIGQRSDWALFALGKLGGSALGYASDIELLFIYGDVGKTNGKEEIANHDFFERFVREIQRIIKAPREGFFKLDLRLRPHGDAGPLAVRLNNYMEYYPSNRAHAIERLSLTRLRPIAGDPQLAEQVLRITKSFLYGPNTVNRKDIFDMRTKQIAEKVKPNTRNPKFGIGSLVDVEYSVQMLQLVHGQAHVELQQPSIHNALIVLHKIGEISKEDADLLSDAYLFYRLLINGLRMRRGNANDIVLPEENSWELEHLARRINYAHGELSAGEKLLIDFDRYSAQVNDFINYYFENEIIEKIQKTNNPAHIVFTKRKDEVVHLLKKFENPAQAFASIHACAKTRETKVLFSQLLLLGWVRIFRRGEANLVLLSLERLCEQFSETKQVEFYKRLLEQPKNFNLLIDIFATSRFLSEEIIKNPEYIFYLIDSDGVHKKKSIEEYRKDIAQYILAQEQEAHADKKGMQEEASDQQMERKILIREFRKKDVLRIMVRDVCVKAPLSHICTEISNLAQIIIQNTFEYVAAQKGLDTTGIAVFAFGKLGSFELNYSSDLDLMCVYDETCTLEYSELVYFFRETVKLLTEYTAEGIAYRIDLRLRPYGESGDIVSSTQILKSYYLNDAQLWEIQATLKLSAVAGDEKLALQCYDIISETSKKKLCEYTPKEILKNIDALRTRSVKAHFGNEEKVYEVKNSWGGIRDIEFVVQALQLIYYEFHKPKQTTLQALVYLKKQGYIPEQVYLELTENYLFLRKVEHFLQVYEDLQLHEIPKNDAAALKRLSWLLLEEQDEDMFLKKLAKVKAEAHAVYKRVIVNGEYEF